MCNTEDYGMQFDEYVHLAEACPNSECSERLFDDEPMCSKCGTLNTHLKLVPCQYCGCDLTTADLYCFLCGCPQFERYNIEGSAELAVGELPSTFIPWTEILVEQHYRLQQQEDERVVRNTFPEFSLYWS